MHKGAAESLSRVDSAVSLMPMSSSDLGSTSLIHLHVFTFSTKLLIWSFHVVVVVVVVFLQ